MNRSHALLLGALVALAPAAAAAEKSVPIAVPAQAPLSHAEQTFYAVASAALRKLYPHPAAAERAGWFRFNNEDDTGAISYINPAYFNTPDPQHPQELWYDVRGRLLGGDFSQTVAFAPHGPALFGISRKRFHRIPLHVHYGIKHAGGRIEYGVFVRAKEFTAAGLDPLHPTAADLVKLGKVRSTADVAFVFANLNNWDAEMWLIPNPAGQFADANPDVTPSPEQAKLPSERQT
jgi:hypothetical protein